MTAIITLANTGQSGGECYPADMRPERLFQLDLLGKSVLDRTQLRLRDAGVSSCRVVSVPSQMSVAMGVTAFLGSWEREISEAVKDGAKLLFLVRLDAYADLDYAELLRFHLEAGSSFTEVDCPNASLNIALVGTDRLRQEQGGFGRALSLLLPERETFRYVGYARQLTAVRDFHDLMQDGLNGRCGFNPEGSEVTNRVWCGEGARIDPSANIAGPAFLGTGCQIGAGCAISGSTSVERDCHIDCGTSVRDTLILQNTYLGVGLDVNRTVTTGGGLFHLDRNVAVQVGDTRVVGTVKRFRPLARAILSRK